MISKKFSCFLKMPIIALAIILAFSCTTGSKTIEESQESNEADPYAFPLDTRPGSGAAQTMIPGNSPYDGARPQYSYYTNIGLIRTRTSDAVPSTVVVEMVLGYDLNDNMATTELNERMYELRDFVRSFFRSKTAAELQPENEARLKQEIVELLNTRVFSTARIRMVFFNQFDVMDI
jgi:flagellar FliL protein